MQIWKHLADIYLQIYRQVYRQILSADSIGRLDYRSYSTLDPNDNSNATLTLKVRPVVPGGHGVLPPQRVPPVCRRPLRRPRLRLGHRGRRMCKVSFWPRKIVVSIRGLPSMTSALEGGGVVEKWTRVLISCVIMYVTRGGGGKKIRNFHGRH